MADKIVKELDLSKLAKGLVRAISAKAGANMMEACAVCFTDRKHSFGVELKIEAKINGSSAYYFQIPRWDNVTEEILDCWNDLDVAVEYAAYGLSILLIVELTEYTVIRRSKKLSGIDYWLGKKGLENALPFEQGDARLEVSGMLKGSNSRINDRVEYKIEQSKKSDTTNTPAYIVVVQFTKPIARMVKR